SAPAQRPRRRRNELRAAAAVAGAGLADVEQRPERRSAGCAASKTPISFVSGRRCCSTRSAAPGGARERVEAQTEVLAARLLGEPRPLEERCLLEIGGREVRRQSLSRSSARAAQRGSGSSSACSCGSRLRSLPQTGPRPAPL